MSMTICRFMTFASFVILLACNRQQTTRTTAGASKTKSGTVASEADFRNAKVKETITPAVVEETTDARLGNHANPQGVVVLETKEFKPGEPVILSMTVKQSPSGLQMRAVWADSKGTIIDEGKKAMNGAKVATFAYAGKKLAPGEYTVTGYWGGNIATEKRFVVRK